MTKLLLAELSRLRSRRLTWVALVLVALALALLQLSVGISVRPLSAEELAQGQVQYQQALREYEQNKEQYAAEEQTCRDSGGTEEGCDFAPKPEYFSERFVQPFPEIAHSVLTGSVLLTALALLFLGASFIGAEYSSGSLANWLSFIPERTKVFASKLGALVLFAALVTAITSTVTILSAVLISRAVGAQISGVGNLFQIGGRGVVLGCIGAVFGFALALLTRHTIAAAGIVLGYLFVAYVLVILTDAITSLQVLKPWAPERNLLAFLDHGHTYQVYTRTVTESGAEGSYIEKSISFAHSAGYWAVLVAVVVAVTFAVFRRRDVT
ncbi:MAG TPA: ABC transporter permease subunit [Propionibacteriaceae bacterium]|jgi:ABC-2 type transport system permease protein